MKNNSLLHFPKIISVIFIMISLNLCFTVKAQYLSNLHATQNDPVYTTYAAPLSRSNYKIDQGYEFMWYDNEKGVGFESKDGGNLGIAFKIDDEFRYKLGQFYKEPIITTSYSDLVKYYYYPFRNIRVEVFFDVYSSQSCIQEIIIKNESKKAVEINVYPYFYLPNDTIFNTEYTEKSYFSFYHNKKRDGWMINHNIPLIENLQSIFYLSDSADNHGIYANNLSNTIFDKSGILNKNTYLTGNKLLVFQKNLKIKAKKEVKFSVIRGIFDAESNTKNNITECRKLKNIDLNKLVTEDEKIYSNIPELNFKNKDYEAVYWNAFTLIRQCMMPPEGECSYNYYIFSREPKWGWGYGGQVFHESLVMLAYTFMDAESAMNSQRVYMERQLPKGYINYRTGPYLNEKIEHNNQFTSSAPWYNYQNLEIYKITKDKQFLKEAYKSGKKFYNYYVNNRDADNDGLCEWGAHAVLECVRDARVAVWDKVGWPTNFEGPDINAMLVSEAKALSEMARELGYKNESEIWKEKANKRTELINSILWDNETGFYYNVDKNDQNFTFKNNNDLKIKEIIGFLPLWAGVASEEQADELVKCMTNPEEFWRKYGIPTLSAKDDYYNPIGYWNGPVWVQWQYLLFRGLLDYGYKKQAKELAEKVLSNVTYHLKNDHVFWEFYSADDLQAGWNKTYIWTGIVARMLIDIEEDVNKGKR
ncbi:MAG: hypothetical protein KAV70_00290 [Bacteroidales bacterium]|nr:hypothetical protein [Bacteroidales bacterium]